jgi:uncharacterized protein YfaS (alpha-2-macroglobulin family)
LYGSQGDDSAITLVGLGELPKEQLVIKFDKLNYKPGEGAILTINGPASSPVSLLILDPSDNPVRINEVDEDDPGNKQSPDTLSLLLGPDGELHHTMNLTGYSSGIYTAVLKRGNAQTQEVFTVGLLPGSGEISVTTTKTTYSPGDQILIRVNSNPTVLVKLFLMDPDGVEKRVKDTFTNKEGTLSDDSFRIPSEAQSGIWSIIARSGPHNSMQEFEVIGDIIDGITVIFIGIEEPSGERIVSFRGYGASPGRSVIADFTDPNNNIVESTTQTSTSSGEFHINWALPKDATPGLYTITVRDNEGESASITFDVPPRYSDN